MRRFATAGLLAGLVMTFGSLAAAEDETAPQRMEIAEARVSIVLPSAWTGYVEMRERQDFGLYDEGHADAPVPFWNVIYASGDTEAWCDLVWYPEHPLSLDDHAARYAALMTPTHSDVERRIDVAPVTLPAGEAVRFVIYNEPTDDQTTTYLVGVADARYLLQCVDTERAADDWLSVASSLEVDRVQSANAEEG